MITLNEIKLLDNEDLVDLYAAIVRIDHYDPYETPKSAKTLYEAGITQHDIKKEIIVRLKLSNHR